MKTEDSSIMSIFVILPKKILLELSNQGGDIVRHVARMGRNVYNISARGKIL
jgi:hypothetical protein